MNGIKFKGYKAFSDDWISIENFPNITVLIGRNNSGKSSCIDVIESLTNPIVYKQCQELGLDVIMEHNLTEEEVKSVFPESTYGGGIPANNFWEFGKNFIGERVAFDVGVQSRYIGEGVEFLYNWCSNEEIFQKKYERYWKLFESRQVNDWEGYCVRRLSAERNILPEVEEDSEYLESTGVGASNLIRKILNYSGYDENLIEKELLGALNYIIYPESQYSGIKVQQIRKDDGIYWEIYLIENERRFPLSRMGSGLKTIILVLLNLLIIPQFEKGDKDKIIYAFEELENNLHPALQRRLFDYLYQYSCKHDVMMFLTTHSHIAINAFSEKEKVQILHVMKNNQVSTIQRIDNYFSKSELLNDLDIRASDLLQSNGIVWVEGPSDRVYVKRWIELEGIKFQEGRDYQFMYYGGRLLSHYTMKEADDMINVLMTNRNAAILIDSDKRTKNSRINDTKKRIREEFQSNNMFCWITKGKEIENYIPWEAINKKYPRIDKQCGEYELFPEYKKTVYPGFVQSKVKFAKEICPYITKENSSELLDLQKNIKLLIEQIKKWNKI